MFSNVKKLNQKKVLVLKDEQNVEVQKIKFESLNFIFLNSSTF